MVVRLRDALNGRLKEEREELHTAMDVVNFGELADEATILWAIDILEERLAELQALLEQGG